MTGRAVLQVSAILAFLGAAGNAREDIQCDSVVPSPLGTEQAMLQVVSAKHIKEARISSNAAGYPGTGVRKSRGLWCEVDIPHPAWNLKQCPTQETTLPVKILSYNLYWWNLFVKHHGSHRSAGHLIARTSGRDGYDFMGFQECDDRGRILGDALASGLNGDYGTLDGGRAIAIAYKRSIWTLLEWGHEDVGEDSWQQHYGKRSVVWGRFQHHHAQKTVFFMNHHGPLKVSQGGGCTGSATAMNIMRVIAERAHANDAIILVGDFNAEKSSSRIREMDRRLNRVLSGSAMGGLDHIFTNCPAGAYGKILEKGDGHHKSDHDALRATIRV